MRCYVLKYGGTSVETTEKIMTIADYLVKRSQKGDHLVVVVSAMGKTTNNLIDLASEITDQPSLRELDLLMATGEQVSISLLGIAIKSLGGDSISLTGFQAGIETDDLHTKARIESIDHQKIESYLNERKIVIVAGFQGITNTGEITTLGRGGSDTTAVSLAASLGCSCEIYTDVDGVYTVDPRIFKGARKLSKISYEEMLEMASTGSKVLETRSVEMAHKYKVPILVALSSGNVPGTYIKEMDEEMEKKVVTGLSVDENCLMVTINMVPFESKNVAMIFSSLAANNVNIDMISQTAPYNSFVNITFTARVEDKHNVKKVIESFKEELPTIDYMFDTSVTKVSVVGVGMVSQSGVAARLFEIFSQNDIDFFQVTTSEISISYTINHYDRDKLVNLIATEFEL